MADIVLAYIAMPAMVLECVVIAFYAFSVTFKKGALRYIVRRRDCDARWIAQEVHAKADDSHQGRAVQPLAC